MSTSQAFFFFLDKLLLNTFDEKEK